MLVRTSPKLTKGVLALVPSRLTRTSLSPSARLLALTLVISRVARCFMDRLATEILKSLPAALSWAIARVPRRILLMHRSMAPALALSMVQGTSVELQALQLLPRTAVVRPQL